MSQIACDSVLAVSEKGIIDVYKDENWGTLPEIESNITDLTIVDSTIMAVDDEGTIFSFVEKKNRYSLTYLSTTTVSTKTNAPHFFSLNNVIAITKEFFLVFDLEGNQVDKYPNPVNMPFSLYKNNPDYAVLSYEDHLLVWDHVFKESHYFKLSAPLTD